MCERDLGVNGRLYFHRPLILLVPGPFAALCDERFMEPRLQARMRRTKVHLRVYRPDCFYITCSTSCSLSSPAFIRLFLPCLVCVKPFATLHLMCALWINIMHVQESSRWLDYTSLKEIENPRTSLDLESNSQWSYFIFISINRSTENDCYYSHFYNSAWTHGKFVQIVFS